MRIFRALTDVRDDFVLDSALPERGTTPLRSRRSRRLRDQSLGGITLRDFWVAGLCAVIALGVLVAAVQVGRLAADPPPAVSPPESNTDTTPEGYLIYESHGDGTCTVRGNTEGGQWYVRALHIPAISPDGDRVTAIAPRGFAGQVYMTNLYLPETVEIIGEEAFVGNHLYWVTLPEGLRRIEARAFAHSNLRFLSLPASLEYMADDALAGTNLTAIRYGGVDGEWVIHDAPIETEAGK